MPAKLVLRLTVGQPTGPGCFAQRQYSHMSFQAWALMATVGVAAAAVMAAAVVFRKRTAFGARDIVIVHFVRLCTCWENLANRHVDVT